MSSASLVLCVCVFFFKQIHIKNNLKTIFIPWSDKQSVESFGLGEIGSLWNAVKMDVCVLYTVVL